MRFHDPLALGGLGLAGAIVDKNHIVVGVLGCCLRVDLLLSPRNAIDRTLVARGVAA